MGKKNSIEELFGLAAYKAKPQKREEEIALLLHAMILSAGFKCIGAHEDEEESNKDIIVPKKWADQKADGVYGFRYKSENKKYNLQVKVVCTGSELLTQAIKR